MNRKKYIPLFVLLLLLTGCGAFGKIFGKSLVISGESLKFTGNEFVRVAAIYKQGCDVTKTIAQNQCQGFRKFGEHFQKSFPIAVNLWEAARTGNDAALQKNAEGAIETLTTRLSDFDTGGK